MTYLNDMNMLGEALKECLDNEALLTGARVQGEKGLSYQLSYSQTLLHFIKITLNMLVLNAGVRLDDIP